MPRLGLPWTFVRRVVGRTEAPLVRDGMGKRGEGRWRGGVCRVGARGGDEYRIGREIWDNMRA